MSQKAAAAIDMILRRGQIAVRSSAEIGNYVRPFSNVSSNSHSFRRKDQRFSPKQKRIDFSLVKTLDDAVQLFDDMVRREPQPSVLVYNNLLSITAKMEQYTFALHMFDEMRGMGVPMNEWTMNIVINCCCLEKRVGCGFAVMGSFFKSGYEPNVATLCTLIKGLFLDDKVADALKLFEKILDLRICEPNDVMFLTVIDGLCKAGQIIEAHDLLLRLDNSGWRPNVMAYNALLDGLCKGGMVDDALELLSNMVGKGILPDIVSYSSVIEGLCNVDRMKDVEDLLNEMAEFKIPLDAFTFNIFINSYCKEGKMKEAEDMLEKMKQQNICPSLVSYNTLIWGSKENEKKIHWVAWLKMTKRKEDGGLGFRKLRCFNLAMLARQWWYLLQNQDTIIFHILKAKYFPRQELNDAKLGYRPSYMWRSLLIARELVNEGIAWKIGNGESVRAISERWIGGPFPKRISRHSDNIDDDFKVAELINHDRGEWNRMLVQQLFPDDADQIVAIPISSRMPCDRKVWGFTKDGRFTVKSAYRLAVSLESEDRDGGIGTSAPSNQWKQIWNLKILPKITHFLWQACNDSLPSLVNLVRRGVEIDPICGLCGEEEETQTHLFLRCRTTSQIWRMSAPRLRGIENFGSFKNFLWCSLMRYSKEFIELLTVVAWNIWIARNKKYMENKDWCREEVLSRIQRAWEEVCSISTNHTKVIRPKCANPRLWSPPTAGWWKLDIDVAVLTPLQIGMGFVLRRDNGEVVLAAKKEMAASGGSTSLEGLAMNYALNMMRERGYDRIEAASDNKGLIQAIRGEVVAGEFDRMIVDDIKELATTFQHISFVHILREFNNAAHYIARGKEGIFCNGAPEHIRHYV